MFKLYYKGRLVSEHFNFDEAEAQARWHFFTVHDREWEGYEMPPQFMILMPPCALKDAA